MPSRTASSRQAVAHPPDARTARAAYRPSAGLPIASDLAMLFGRTGVMASAPRWTAVLTGAQPCACAAWIRVGASVTRPAPISSWNAFAVFASSDPAATGTTMWSGARQPSCSTISKASVLLPSE